MVPQHTEQDVRQLRVDIDALVQRVEGFASSRELALVKTKLEEAKMWAGKELGNLGVALPPQYQDSAQLPASQPGQAPVEPVPQLNEANAAGAAAPAPVQPAAPNGPVQIPVQDGNTEANSPQNVQAAAQQALTAAPSVPSVDDKLNAAKGFVGGPYTGPNQPNGTSAPTA